MAILFADNAYTYLTAQVLNSATAPFTFTVQDGSLFPSPTGAEYFVVTFEDSSLNRESFKVTSRSGNTFTVSARTYGGGSARTWAASTTLVELRLVSQALTDHLAEATTYSDTKVAKSGDTMTGTLTMSGGSTHIVLPNTPSIDNHAARKKYVDDMFAANLPVNMTTLVYATTAPTGWTRVNDANIHGAALRVHADTAVATMTDSAAPTYGDDNYTHGGTNTFVSTFGTSKSTAGYTLQVADIPAHTHANTLSDPGHYHTGPFGGNSAAPAGGGYSPNVTTMNTSTSTTGITITNASQGGGGAHSHALNFDVKYANFMVVKKSAY